MDCRGVDKGNDYDELMTLVDEKVKAIICLGENNEKIKEAFQSKVETLVEARSAVEAVAYAYRLAEKMSLYCFHLRVQVLICLIAMKTAEINLNKAVRML